MGQNFTTVTATKIQYVNQQLLPKGKLCFLGTDDTGAAINFQPGGGGQVLTQPICVDVINGVAAALSVPNANLTTPANIRYTITVLVGSSQLYSCPGVSVTGASFSFDGFQCATGSLPAFGGVVTGPVTITGNLTLNGTCTGCGTSSAGFSRYYPNESPDGSNEVFHFPATASSSVKFQLAWNGLLMNETDDYTIMIGGGQTTITCVRPPKTGDHLIAYF